MLRMLNFDTCKSSWAALKKCCKKKTFLCFFLKKYPVPTIMVSFYIVAVVDVNADVDDGGGNGGINFSNRAFNP